MKRIFCVGLMCMLNISFLTAKPILGKNNESIIVPPPDGKNFKNLLPTRRSSSIAERIVDSVYQRIHLNAYGLSEEVFFNAYKGYSYLKSRGLLDKSDLLTICDYSQSSHNKRLYVINLATGQLLFNTYVSHGRNSGGEYANNFSNRVNSNKSSLGFMITGSPYHGKAGLSLHLKGQESDFNSNVYERSIVLHGSHYVDASRADEGTMMGRSLGCPAVPYGEQFSIIDCIKGGSCLFIFAPDANYEMSSKILNADFDITENNSTVAQNDNATVAK